MTVCALLMLAVLPASPSRGTGTGPAPTVLGSPEPSAYALPHRLHDAPLRPDLAMTVLNLLNETRTAAGLVPLMPHETLQRIASTYGQALFARGILSHVSPGGQTPRDRVLDAGIRVRVVGENLAYADDVEAAHEALMASAPHRANILYPGYRLVGVAVLDGGEDGMIIVEDFTDDSVFFPLPRWWIVPAAASAAHP